MPGIELDKPSTAPIEDSTEEIKFEETFLNDEPKAVMRDHEGKVAYPNFIPPGIDSPASQKTESSTMLASAKDPKTVTGPKKSHSLPPSNARKTQPTSKALETERPSLEGTRKFLTDAPRRGDCHSVSTIPVIRRAGTNASMLNRALWDRMAQEEDSDSSLLSDEDDEEEGVRAGQAGSRPKERTSEDMYRRFQVANDNYNTKGKISKRDGRLNITVNDTSNTGYLAKALGAAVKRVVPKSGGKCVQGNRPTTSRLSSVTTATSESIGRPSLNIVIMVIGSRGDAQPFLKLGKILKEDYGHRVRIATHPAFRDFVEKDSGLEFFSVGGDPSELMAFMVKNPGMIPKLETVKAGDIGRRRAAMAEMFDGFWRACINATDNEKDTHNLKMMGDRSPFVADAIIANPPSFAHMHCAEALGIPLHLMFTFPYTPTQAFPHPLASIKKSNVDPGYTNFISYPLVEMMVWQGLGDLVNDFRIKTLGLDPVSTLWAPGATYRLHVPFTYLWSPGLVPKPEDWGEEIDISGFVFLDLASSFEPPKDLVEFLDGGDKPIYIGFGSIVVDDADKFTEMIFDAVERAGVRALVSKGWGGLGQDNVPDTVYMLGNTPHDWLFPQVKAAVIHGGAGTTAIALKCGIPTMIVPFFGDQNFWGSMVGSARAGPDPVPYKKLNVEKLAEGIKFCLTDEARDAAQSIARDIELEGDGAKNAVRSFHHHLTLSGEQSMRCSVLSDRVAVWKVKDTSLKLSALAADILVEKGYLSWRKLRLVRHKEWNDFEGPGEPLTGIAGSLMGTVGDFFGGFGSVPYRLAKTSNKRAERKKARAERHAARRKRKSQQKKNKKVHEHKLNNNIVTANDCTDASGSAGFPFPDARIEAKDQAPGQKTHQQIESVPNPDICLTDTETPGTGGTDMSVDDNPAEEYANDFSEGLAKSGRAIAHAPVDLSMAIAQGFHNAPRLYGDDTVRRPPRVTGMRSGLRAARSEFFYGVYDGVTGIVRLPVKGAKEDGVRGALAGVGMGIGGFVLKDLAALAAPFGYTLKGIAKQIEKQGAPIKYIRRARIVQAQREMFGMSEEERKALSQEVYKGWDVMRQLSSVIMRENSKRGLMGHLEVFGGKRGKKGQQLGKWGMGRAFESVQIAEKAIAAIQRGENVEDVLGKETKPEVSSSTNNKKSEDTKRKSVDTHKSEERRVLNQETTVRNEIQDEAEMNARRAVEEDVETEGAPGQRQDATPTEIYPGH
ncbi:uncharacterized protein BCR38DRAFT_445994 [Pseudomassariella vexata]|uniref:Uncharacterized protein n=1 Tax=Pseudomassariella vexata TaxID=1141098 RepID=A0A1Y2DJ60_9PEZI|nr:uncharacterized protein BCR38DRAFT_445994 [Pseudomassariella vexata]ORY59250.1 hypothetical protein BCR38DRAFT_445994 [Pseudomassariella vexata]